jgi:hypothetical protein
MTDLTKWPRLIVVGENVTPKQANEILVRTHNWGWFMTNDKEWEGMVRNLVGAPPERSYLGEEGKKAWEEQKAFVKKMRTLDLEYLGNQRIMSSWIGGPHGWCDWDGTIGAANYNIGKWPTVDDVAEEWCTIANAFPYLKLTAQLVPDEGESPMSVARFEIADGGVTTSETVEEPLRKPEELDMVTMLTTIRSYDGERGVDFQRLHQAVRQVWEE